jgi:stage III sporulation protein AE
MTAHAETNTSSADFTTASDGGDYGADKIMEALPEDVRDSLEQNGFAPDNGGVVGVSAGGVLDYIFNAVAERAGKPLQLLVSLAGVILLCALAEALRDSAGSSRASSVFAVVGVLAGAGLICGYIGDCVVQSSAVLTAFGTFLLTFVPVFAGIMAIAGQLTTASVFASVIVVAAQVFSAVLVAVLSPLTGCMLGLAVAGAVTPELKVDAVSDTIRKVVVFILGLMIAIFVGLLSIQGFVTASADSVTMKAAKFVVSGGVPFVGGAVSEALATVKGSLGVVRASTGTFGIVAALAIVAPVLIEILLLRLSLAISGMLCDLFGVKQLSALIKTGANIMGIAFAMLVSFVVLAIVSVALMLYMSGGGSA